MASSLATYNGDGRGGLYGYGLSLIRDDFDAAILRSSAFVFHAGVGANGWSVMTPQQTAFELANAAGAGGGDAKLR